MVNEKVNKRIAITLPLEIVQVCSAYAKKHNYVRVSDVIRKFIETSAEYKTFKLTSR